MATATSEQDAFGGECFVHLHIPFDMGVESERRFAELFNALPNGLKTHFCKSLLVDAVPEVDTDIDLLLAKLIRQQKIKAKPRGRPRSSIKKMQPPASTPRSPVPQASVVSSSSEQGEQKPVSSKEHSAPADLSSFNVLAGGKSWDTSTAGGK